METLISNINNVQRRTRGTRSFLVAPASLIVPGVLNGSKGRLFYPQDEIQKVVDPWNGMPVVIYHPTKQGQPISGRHPDVFDVGRVYNAKYNGRLTAEAWIDEELLLGVDQGAAIRDRLLSGDKIELSTGLYTENEKKSGVDQATGQAYDYIARNYRPDHLAILPDQRGACSLNDGCGLNVNSLSGVQTVNKDQLVNWLIASSGVWTEEDRATLNSTEEPKLKAMKDKLDKPTEPVKKTGCTCDGQTNNTVQTPTPVAKPMTPAEWLAAAPPEWTSVLNNAKDIELQERQKLANVLVANTVDENARKAAYTAYVAMPLQTLRTLAAAAPTANAAKPDDAGGLLPFGYQPQYHGAGGGPIAPTVNAGVNKTDIIPLQEIDWKELSTSTMKS